MTALVIGLGGALGAVARYWASEWVRALAGGSFPWGTLAVNVVGSFALGFLLVWLQSMTPSAQARQFLTVGFLGSFTTFSTFSHDAVTMAQAGQMLRAGGYAAGSVIVGMAAVVIGAALAGALVQART